MGGLGVGRCDSGWEPRIAEQDYQSFLGFCVFVSLFFVFAFIVFVFVQFGLCEIRRGPQHDKQSM